MYIMPFLLLSSVFIFLITNFEKHGGLKTVKIYSFTTHCPVCDMRFTGPKPRSYQGCIPSWGTREAPLLISSCFWGLLTSAGLWSHSLPSCCLCVHIALFCQCQISLCFCFIRTLVIAFKFHLDNPNKSLHFKIFNLFTSAKSCFGYQITFIGSRD